MQHRVVRTRQTIVLDVIRGWRRGQLGRFDVVVDELEPELKTWPRDRIEKVLNDLIEDPLTSVDMSTAQSLVFSGSDRSIYDKAMQGIRGKWGEHQGLREVSTLDVSMARNPKDDEGDWIHPDVLMLAHPRRRDHGETAKRTHAIEVECFDGFSIASVYQALEQGRGADYAWVFAVVQPTLSTNYLERIVGAAKEQGVGLVLMGRISSPAQWVTKVPALRKSPTSKARADLFQRCNVNALSPFIDTSSNRTRVRRSIKKTSVTVSVQQDDLGNRSLAIVQTVQTSDEWSTEVLPAMNVKTPDTSLLSDPATSVGIDSTAATANPEPSVPTK